MPIVTRETTSPNVTNKNAYLTNSEVDGNFIYLNERIVYSGTSAPSSPINGQVWYNTTNNTLYIYDTIQAVWVDQNGI